VWRERERERERMREGKSEWELNNGGGGGARSDGVVCMSIGKEDRGETWEGERERKPA